MRLILLCLTLALFACNSNSQPNGGTPMKFTVKYDNNIPVINGGRSIISGSFETTDLNDSANIGVIMRRPVEYARVWKGSDFEIYPDTDICYTKTIHALMEIAKKLPGTTALDLKPGKYNFRMRFDYTEGRQDCWFSVFYSKGSLYITGCD